MSWKQTFLKGMRCLREGDVDGSLPWFTKALEANPENPCIVYDARSSALEKLGRYKEALKDVRKTIELAPEQWQGYNRAARLFYHLKKYSHATKMIDAALDRYTPISSSKRTEMEALKAKIAAAHTKYLRQTRNHSAILPIELFSEVVYILLDEDSTSVLRLSHVCQHWQSVMASNPLFWRTLVLGKSRPHIKAKHWVARSQGRIRDLRIKAEALDKGWSGQGLEGIDWSYLQTCSIAKWDFCRFVKSTTLSSLSSYEFISEDRLPVDTPMRLFDTAWPLQQIALQGTPLPPYFNDLPGESISSLALRNTTGTMPLALEKYGSLRTLVLENEQRIISEYPPNLNQLQHLEIHRVNEHSEKLLGIAMPELHILHIRNSPRVLDQYFNILAGGSPSHLTQLVLSGIPIRDERPLVGLVASMERLEKLELSKLSIGVNAVVNHLARAGHGEGSDGAPPCAHLIELNLSHCSDLRTSPLVRLVASRNVPSDHGLRCAKIQSLNVDGCEGVEAGKLPWFRTHVPTFSCIYRTKNVVRYRR
ncbi:hypothetical protein CC1G_07137 [Coprinopsis cinerea okayama7|uniref:Uncharacterized protein n=1 Tax=Coprinopsis cinerea (strain Okayama-7 / 130 / ATCC MYA-4618 / FGSC 9003) TaxID=240176 RepID=A8NR72_COPC7|nr:hypothetical protein CC1G_07137 [Coprinopsis cinerea okayama7\|eukprot:XP_001835713.2 hypothetical protein CC1G_07137 [Coprinopsis cinerea okayama7\